MLKVFTILLAVMLSFVAGMYYQRLDQTEVVELRQRLDQQKQSIQRLTDRNDELSETLSIVKRQVQTDRIAYASLQQTVDSSANQQVALRKQLEDARALLKQLRQRLDAEQDN